MEATSGDGGGRDPKELDEEIRVVEVSFDGLTFSLPEYSGGVKKQIGLGITNKKISESEPSVMSYFSS
jgi:hypothetical protein